MFLVMRNTPGRGLGTARGCYCAILLLPRGEFVLTIPSQVDAHETGEPHQGVTHEGHTTALRGGAEEGDLGLVAPELLGIGQHGFPCGMATGVLVVLDRGQMGTEASVGLDDAAPADLEERDERRAKVPGIPCQLGKTQKVACQRT